MKTAILSLFSISLSLCAYAAETAKSESKPGSPEFERMKSLVGTWTGKCDMGKGPEDVTIRYRLISGGSVVEERIAEGTPNEMVSMYYDDNGKLAMTHYCMMGNRPAMKVTASDDKSITLDFDAAHTSIDPAKESHMHGCTIRFDDANTITTSCKAIMDGKEMAGNETKLTRVK